MKKLLFIPLVLFVLSCSHEEETLCVIIDALLHWN